MRARIASRAAGAISEAPRASATLPCGASERSSAAAASTSAVVTGSPPRGSRAP